MIGVDDASIWEFPAEFLTGGDGPVIAKWFAGLVTSDSATSAHSYALDVPASLLAVRNQSGALVPLTASDGAMGAGSWVLALRLRHEWQPDHWREAAFIPVMRIDVSEDGEVTYSVYEDVRGESPP